MGSLLEVSAPELSIHYNSQGESGCATTLLMSRSAAGWRVRKVERVYCRRVSPYRGSEPKPRLCKLALSVEAQRALRKKYRHLSPPEKQPDVGTASEAIWMGTLTWSMSARKPVLTELKEVEEVVIAPQLSMTSIIDGKGGSSNLGK